MKQCKCDRINLHLLQMNFSYYQLVIIFGFFCLLFVRNSYAIEYYEDDLVEAIKTESIDDAITILQSKPILIKSTRCLICAIQSGSIKLVGYFIDHGAELNYDDGRSWGTPFQESFTVADPEMVQYLIERGGDIHSRTTSGASVVCFAAMRDPWSEEMVTLAQSSGYNLFSENKYGYNALDEAIRHQRSPATLKILFEKGVDPWKTVAGKNVLEGHLEAYITSSKSQSPAQTRNYYIFILQLHYYMYSTVFCSLWVILIFFILFIAISIWIGCKKKFSSNTDILEPANKHTLPDSKSLHSKLTNSSSFLFRIEFLIILFSCLLLGFVSYDPLIRFHGMNICGLDFPFVQIISIGIILLLAAIMQISGHNKLLSLVGGFFEGMACIVLIYFLIHLSIILIKDEYFLFSSFFVTVSLLMLTCSALQLYRIRRGIGVISVIQGEAKLLSDADDLHLKSNLWDETTWPQGSTRSHKREESDITGDDGELR